MVGAGFSLNAEPLAGARSRFPVWRELARAMFDGLPPRTSDTEESREKAKSTSTRQAPYESPASTRLRSVHGSSNC